MKHLIYLTFSFFLFACSTTKTITQTPPKETTPILGLTASEEKLPTINTTEKTLDTSEVFKTEYAAVSISNNNTRKPELKKNALAPHQLWNQLLQKYVSNSGNVNYKGLKTEKVKLTTYITTLGNAYSDISFKPLSKEEKLAFWINAYNAMTVDLILKNYPIKSIKDIDKPWDQRFWRLGEKWFNLNDIEHEILRKMNEPRIHFAIVCASVSCPKLQNTAFIASNIETQLTNATKEFLSDLERNELSENSIKISKIFQWFSKDFKQNGDLIKFLNQYSDVEISAKAKKSFKDYNWNLNE